MDFICPCGAHSHTDEDFTYNIQCYACGAIYELGTSVTAKLVDKPTGNVVETTA